MPTLYKNTAIFQGPQKGWTEIYYMDADLVLPPAGGGNPNNRDNLEAVEGVFLALLVKRTPLLGEQCSIKAVRTARLLQRNRARLTYTNLPGFTGANSDNLNTSLVATCQNDLNDRQKQIHMRGIWDDVDVRAGVFDPAPAGWVNKWNSFAAALIQGPWGWYGFSSSTTADLLDYAQTVDGYVSFSLAANLFAGVPVGSNVQVRLSGVNTTSELNGQLLVTVDGPAACHSTKRISVFPYVGGGKMRYGPKGFIKIATVRPQKIGERRSGSPLLELRGRAKATVRS